MNRADVLKQIHTSLQSNIAELSQALAGYEAASNLNEGDTMDPDDYSKKAEYKEMQMRMQIQLDLARAQLERLEELTSIKTNSAEAGAIVVTKSNQIFIGVSFPTLHPDGKEIIGITTESPLYGFLKGKGKGDSFSMGKTEFVIEAIY